MTAASSLLFASRMIFPRAQKSSSARRAFVGAVVCIGVSLVPLIAVITVSDGLIDGMTERIIGLSSSHISAFAKKGAEEARTLENFLAWAERIKNEEGVVAAYPEVDMTALAAGSASRAGVLVRAVETGIFEKNKSFKSFFKIVEGSRETFTAGARTALVGQKTAERLGVHPGDSFRLVTASTSRAGSIIPKTAKFTVAAVVSSGYQELDNAWVFIPLETFFESVESSQARRFVLVETADAFSPNLALMQKKLSRSLRGSADVWRWDELNQSELENFSSTKIMLLFIMALIVLVASINISSSLVMLVMERKKETAILKCLGATSSGVSLSFLSTGMAAGCGGALIGVPLGLLCSVNINAILRFMENVVNAAVKIFHAALSGNPQASRVTLMDPAYYLTEIPVHVPLPELFLTVALTLALSLAVSVAPALKAGKEKPLDTIRKA